jgi:sec-independent protein translocase protein TatC
VVAQRRDLIATNVVSSFVVPIKILFMAAFMIALPWCFTRCGLSLRPVCIRTKKKLVMPFGGFPARCCFIGVAFHYVVFGQVFKFVRALRSITARRQTSRNTTDFVGMFLAFGCRCLSPSFAGAHGRADGVNSRIPGYAGSSLPLALRRSPPDAGSMIGMLLAVVRRLYEVGILAARPSKAQGA